MTGDHIVITLHTLALIALAFMVIALTKRIHGIEDQLGDNDD